jgi:sporulation protein YlmC with PRC-barrel domain
VLSLAVAGNSSAQTMSDETTGNFRLTAMSFETFKASDLIGMQLYTTEMDVLGQISDVVIDPATKRISWVIVSDIPGMGGETNALPFNSLVKIGNNIIAYSAPGAETTFLPSSYGGRSMWPTGNYWLADLDYVLSYAEPIPAGSKESSHLAGARIETPKGEDVAWINDLVVDSENGHIVYLVLSDVGGAENRQVAVPFEALSEPHEKVFVLNTTKDKLLAASEFKWEDALNRTYAEGIYRYYGLHPYWETE